MKKKLIVTALMVAITIPLVAYAYVEMDKGGDGGKSQEAASDVTKFNALVNGIKHLDIFVCVDIGDGLTEKEAELIVGTTFIQAMGEYIWHRLVTLTFDDTEVEAHYAWGLDETDLVHICDMTVNLTSLVITVDHCH